MQDIKKLLKKFANEKYKTKNASLRSLCIKASVDPEVISRVLRGYKGRDYNPGLEVVDKCFKALGTSWGQFAKYVNQERKK